MNAWLLLVLVTFVVACVLHWRIRRAWLAITLASIAGPVLMLAVARALHGPGALDGMVLILGAAVSLPVSCLAGALFVRD